MRKRRCKYTTVLNVLLGLWTVGVLYGSLAPGDDLPSAGWFDWIPYFDKVVHWGFYFGETLLLLLRFNQGMILRQYKAIWVMQLLPSP